MTAPLKDIAGCDYTNGQAWTIKTRQWEKELREAGWSPGSAHPHSELWKSPEGQWYPGVFFAWSVMKGLQK